MHLLPSVVLGVRMMKRAQSTVHVRWTMHVILAKHQDLVKHQVAQGKESVDPGKSPLARCAVWTLHRKGASELCLQEYTLENLSQSHELSPHRLQQNYSKSAFVTELIIAWFGQESHILHGSA